MKIGILTQPLESNYGGILQNFALQTALRKLGHEPITLRTGRYTVKDWFLKNIKELVKACLGKKAVFRPFPTVYEKRKTGIESFVRNHIVTTKKLSWYTPSIVTEYGVEALIVGSDKVWARYFAKIEDMFFAFAKTAQIPKLSYAPSFGTDRWSFSQEKTALLRELVKDFSGVSVREYSGLELCRKNLGVEAVWVLDPTMLLNADDYNELCADIPKADKPFLFAYILDLTKEKADYIHNAAVALGLDVIIQQAELKISADDTIEKWLAMYRDAAYVITDSFHGTVFSLLYHKEFVSLINSSRGADRFLSLGRMFSLEKHFLDSIPPVFERITIDWERIDEVFSTRKKEAFSFLEKSLSKK